MKGATNDSKSMIFLGINSAGLGSKFSTVKKVLLELRPSVFFVEETQFKEEGTIKVDNFVVRETRDGGGRNCINQNISDNLMVVGKESDAEIIFSW